MTALVSHLRKREDGTQVPAELLEGLIPKDLLLVEAEWRPERSRLMQELLRAGVARPRWPQSLHWNWERKAPQLASLESAGFGITYDGQWQGMMLIRSATAFAQLAGDLGKPLIYIDYLEAAPWNWPIPELSQVGRYSRVGAHLFVRAVEASFDEGFAGRVGLHALPQAEEFYVKGCGMTPVGCDTRKEDLLYLELTRTDAQVLLNRR